MDFSAAHSFPLSEGGTPAGSPLWRLAAVFFAAFSFIVPPANADWRPLTERLVADGFNEQTLQTLFSRPEVRFEPTVMAGKISVLVKRHEEGPSVSGPLSHNSVYRSFLRHRVIVRARSYLLENKRTLKEVSAGYGVPGEIVVSIILVETGLGRNTGRDIVFNRLASMAYSSDIEKIRPHLNGIVTSSNEEYAKAWCLKKADWAYNELKALLNYAGQNGTDPLSIRGSIYGAIGLCQFMPSNIFSYGIDADNDGRVDPFVTSDAIHSIANYLQKHGWSRGMTREDKRKVIFEYNNSTVYVNTILAVADKIRGGVRAKK